MNLEGFRENRHTADWELEVWAPSFHRLLTKAALGMNYLLRMQIMGENKVEWVLELNSDDYEGLLVKFLNELLYLIECKNLGFVTFDFRIDQFKLSARMQGGEILQIEKEIKSVTWHNIVVEETSKGFQTKIVFDI
jgi:SHS2 domain-containing protein